MQNVICQRCGKRPATTHLTELSPAGGRAELHLCTTCIQLMELRLEAGPPPIAAIIAGAAEEDAPSADGDPAADCPCCGLTFGEFEQGKRFGCTQDYSAWEDRLLPLLAGYHGADRHVGRRPAAGAADADAWQQQRARLDGDLRAAIAKEDYEAAARLRDALRRCQGSAPR
jgi:protein arginine kinase activator